VEPKIKKQDFSTEPFEAKFEEQEKTLGEELKAAFSFETKPGDTLPLATRGGDFQNIKMPPKDLVDFEFPEDLTITPPSMSALSSNKELFLPDEPGQEKINLSIDDISLYEKNEGEQELLSSEERKKILRMKNSLSDQSPREAPARRIKTEPLDDDDIARILEDINPGPSEPGTTT
jgi:hypothetical protein